VSVYFIKVGRYVKVGYSANPERRCAKLWQSGTRYGRPFDLSIKEPRELLAAVDGGTDLEHQCLQALRDYSVGCEFVIDEPGVREVMRQVMAGEEPTRQERPGGEFVPVRGEDMIAEWREDVARMTARARRAVA
jgi:hypothetical protein